MADLSIPKLNKNSNKYIFKKKLNLKRKSRKKLFIESCIMFVLSLSLFYLNYLIPKKNLLLQNLPKTLDNTFTIFIDLIANLYNIFLVFFIFISSIISLILLIGALYRIFRIARRKTKIINYK